MAQLAQKLMGVDRPEVTDLAARNMTAVEIEGNLDLQADEKTGLRVITKSSTPWKASMKITGRLTASGPASSAVVTTVTSRKTIVEFYVEGSGKDLAEALESVRTGSRHVNPDIAFGIKIGPFDISQTPGGRFRIKVDYGAGKVEAMANPLKGEMAAGFTLQFKWVAAMLRRAPFPGAKQWADALENAEVGYWSGIAGLSEDKVLAASPLLNRPGFWQRRPVRKLLAPATKWQILRPDEQAKLLKLGWTQTAWDAKYDKKMGHLIPKSVNKFQTELGKHERVAILELGFDSFEDYRNIVKEAMEAYGG